MYHGILTCPSILPICGCRFVLAEATFLGAWQEALELVLVTFQKATLGSGDPSTKSVLQGHVAEATFLDAWEGVRSQLLHVLEGNVRQWRRPTKHQVCPSAIPAAGAWVHARTMTNMKLPTAATTATMLHTDSSDSARHNVVTEWACVFVDGHRLGWVTGVQNRPTEAGTVQNAPRTHSCLLFAQPLSEFHVELLLKLIYAVAPAALSQWRQALVRYLSIYLSVCLSIYLSICLSVYL